MRILLIIGLIGATIAPAQQPAAQQNEVSQLRDEVNQLKVELQRLRSLVEAGLKTQAPLTTAERGAKSEPEGKPQFTGVPESPKIAIATKAQGGDLSGA